MKRFHLIAILSLLAVTTLGAQDVGFTNAWLELDAQGRERVTRYAEDFKVFLGKAKSEMQFVREAVRYAESNGFRKWDPKAAAGMKPGSRHRPVCGRDRADGKRLSHRQHPHRFAAPRVQDEAVP